MTKIKLIAGDCLKKLSKFEPESVDVIVTSPPYNLGIKYDLYKDNIKRESYLTFSLKVIIELRRVLKPEGSLFINVAGSCKDPMLPFQLALLIHNLGMVLQNNIVWVKSIAVDSVTKGHFKPIPGKRFLNHNHESVLHFTKNGKVNLDRLGVGVPFSDKSNIKRRGHAKDLRCNGDVWYIPYKTKNKTADTFDHPATYPVELAERCIKLHGNVKKLTVLDPFCGVGSTVVAARNQKCKKVIGIDISKKYITITKARLKNAG